MEVPSSGCQYLSSKNPSDSSDDSTKSASANHVIPSGGYHDQQEVDSRRVVFPAGQDDGTSDSERTVSFGGISSDGHGNAMEVDSGLCKARDQHSRSEDAEKDEKHTGHLKAYQGKSVDLGHRQQVIFLQKKKGLLKILPEKMKMERGNGESSIPLKNTEMDGETGDAKIQLTDTMAVAPLPRVHNRREELPVPQWLKDQKSDVADSDGWEHWQVHRYDSTVRRKDKFYRHKDYYVHTFRSKTELQHFLHTVEAKVKGLMQKLPKSCDPGGQSSGTRRLKKRSTELPASDPDRKPQGYGSSTSGEMVPCSSKLPHGFV